MIKISTQDRQQLQNRFQDMNGRVDLQLVLADHKEDNAFISIAKELSEISKKIKITSCKQDSEIPGFRLSDNIFFSAFPLEKEFIPFWDTVEQIRNQTKVPLDPEIQSDLETIEIPVHLKLYIALACPHCPAMVSTVILFALHHQQINLEIIDGSLFPEKTAKDNILSAPSLILDDYFRWTGTTQGKEISSIMAHRDPSFLGVNTLKTILEQGDAEWIADQMVASNNIFKNFISLLLHDTWSVRLGAMVVVETLAEKSRPLAEKLCPILIERFQSVDQTKKGDILYALGETGNMHTLEWIRKTMPALENEELKEAAEEAIDSLTSI